jgi:GNAT superfamily N-acetyltransferase
MPPLAWRTSSAAAAALRLHTLRPSRVPGDNDCLEYLIKQYPLESGALEIQYIEEYFGEFPRKKTAREIVERLADREFLILMAEATLPDDPSAVVPVSFKVVHEIRANETDPKLADLVARLNNAVRFADRKVLYSWIGGTRRDWRGQGHFRALTEESEAWAHATGFHEVVVKTKNRFYDMRGTLDHLEFDVIKYEVHPTDNRESKVYLGKQLTSDVLRAHTSARTVVHA